DLRAVRFRVDDRPQAQFACAQPLCRELALRDVAAHVGNPQRAAVDVVDAEGRDQHRDCRSVVDAAKIQFARPATALNHRRYDFAGEPFMLPRVYKVGYRVPTRAFLGPYTQQLASDIVDKISSAIERGDADKLLTVTYQGRQLCVAAFGGDALLFEHPVPFDFVAQQPRLASIAAVAECESNEECAGLLCGDGNHERHGYGERQEEL